MRDTVDPALTLTPNMFVNWRARSFSNWSGEWIIEPHPINGFRFRVSDNALDGIPQCLQGPVAALCLHGQPFGFDYEDVGALRLLAGGDDTPCSPGCKSCKADAEYRERLTDLADRVAALLPPREPNEP